MPVTKKAGTVARGLAGRIQWHYHIAADVQGFAVERDERGQVWLRAAVTQSNAYRLTQTPLVFIVTVKSGEWQWPILDVVSYRDHAFTARLGEVVITPGRPT